MSETPFLAVIGGTGLYQFPALQSIETIEVDTPFGKPSAPIRIGRLAGRKVAFLARHGIGHHILPHEVNYRANIFALKKLGVKQVIAVSACGSLRDDYAPGSVVIPDQVLDFTRFRNRSFFGNGVAAHVGSAQPFCTRLADAAFHAVQRYSNYVHLGGTAITIEGPRFSTKAESNLFRAWGMSIIGMTTSPEVFLAREAELCYTAIAHVTDYDVWHQSEEPVTVEMVIRTLNQNVEVIQNAIAHLVETLPEEWDDDCLHALDKAIMTHPDHIPAQTRQDLDLLIGKYLPR